MTTILNISNLRMQFGGLVAVDNVNFELKRGQISAIIGPNGAGKTTVFNCISGFYKPTAGQITLDTHDITGLSSHKIARLGLTRTFQNIRLFRDMSVIENLLIARHHQVNNNPIAGILRNRAFKQSEKHAIEVAVNWLETFHLREFANHEAGSLAYGQQRRLEIARAMMTEPKVIILDEPAAGLNPSETAELVDYINLLRDKHGVNILLIEHDMSLVMKISEHIMVMEYGRPIAYGTPTEIRENPEVIKASGGR